MDIFNNKLIITEINEIFRIDNHIERGVKEQKCRPNYCIGYKLSGRTVYNFDDMRFDSEPNKLLFLAKGSSYTTDILEQGECIVVNFELSGSPRLESFVIKPANHAMILNMFLNLEKFYHSQMRIGAYKLYSVLYDIFAEIDNYARFKRISSSGSEKLAAATLFIEQNYRNAKLKYEDIAAHIGISGSRLRVIFTEAYGISPTQYLIQYRLNTVKKMLAESPMTLGEIAAETGFNETTYLSRLFAREIGVSPRDYREQIRREG